MHRALQLLIKIVCFLPLVLVTRGNGAEDDKPNIHKPCGSMSGRQCAPKVKIIPTRRLNWTICEVMREN